MMAGNKTFPSKGRIQMSKTKNLQIIKSSLQRTAGPYRWVINCRAGCWCARQLWLGGIQPVDATPFASNLTRWNGMHMRGMHGHVHAEAEG